MTAADKVFAFMLERCPVDKTSPHLRAWFDWYWRDGRVLAVQDKGEVVAATLMRRVADIAEGDGNQNAHSEAGPLLWVEWATNTRGAKGWKALVDLVAIRWPRTPEFCAFQRFGRDRRAPRILVTERYFERLSHG